MGVFFLAIGYLNFRFHNYLFKGTHQESFLSYYAIGYLSTYCILAAFAYLLFGIKESYKRNTALAEATKKRQQAELSLLKSQINPHFLFNTLNTIYLSALKKEEKVPEMILKLSDSFRYLIHEGQNDFVSLEQEIRHLKDYIDLQQERYKGKIKVDCVVDIDDPEQQIAPLLLMTFVENMFKYASMLKGKQHLLKIRILLRECRFMFYCENPFSENAKKDMDSNWRESGIGLATTRKRLTLLYPGKHELQLTAENQTYQVTLNMQLC